MNNSVHKAEGVNRMGNMRFHPFVFTGKERDEETGYGYFGARYMDHELMTMWLSVDPLADKYPSISPYAYCVWNPVKLVDPDGRDWYRNDYGVPHFSTGFNICLDMRQQSQLDNPERTRFLGKNQWGSTPH